MKQVFYIDSLDWTLNVYCLRPAFRLGPILASLEALNPKDEDLLVAEDLMRSKGLNWGFTFSSYRHRTSVMVIGPAKSQGEYFNTVVHETYHLAKHIAQCDGLDPYSEDVAYIAGDVIQKIYESFKSMICLCDK